MEKIGFFYQTSHNPCAVEMNIRQLRTLYPKAPIALWEDITNDSDYVESKYNVEYKKVYRLPNEAGFIRSRPVSNVPEGLQYLSRLYTSCMTTLKDVEWVMHYEDDVWISQEITNYPTTDWGGGFGWKYDNQDLEKYLVDKLNITPIELYHGACGGAIFKRQSFIDAYLKINDIDWETVIKLDPESEWYSDTFISFLLNHNKVIWEAWSSWEQGGYEDNIVYSRPVIHNLKYWYNKPLEILDEFNSRPEIKFFLDNHS